MDVPSTRPGMVLWAYLAESFPFPQNHPSDCEMWNISG